MPKREPISVPIPDSPETGGSSAEIEPRIRDGISSLCAALSDLIRSLPGPARRATDLAKALSVDIPLASRLVRLSQAADSAEAVELLPTVKQLRRAVERACEAAPGKAAADSLEALARFESLVDEMGGDQRGFESLVSVLSPNGVRRVEIQHRREAFRANTHLWGMSLDAVSFVMIRKPHAERGSYDGAMLYGYIGARAIRQNMQLRLRWRLRVSPPQNPDEYRPAASRAAETAILPEYTTVSSANITTMEPDPDGFEQSLVRLPGHRPSDAATVYARTIREGMRNDAADVEWEGVFMMRWPAANLHIDIVAPAGTTDPASISLASFAHLDNMADAFKCRDEDRIPLHEKPHHLGQMTRLPPIACVPRLNEVFTDTIARMGMAGTRFDVYRVHVEYPMLHSLLRTRINLKR